MKAEKRVLASALIVCGILVTFVGFFIYQSTKVIAPSKISTIKIISPTPVTSSPIFLNIERPVNESVSTIKTISLSGSTTVDATIIISTPSDDQVITPTQIGTFSTNIILDNGENSITITAVNAAGDEITKTIMVAYSTESF